MARIDNLANFLTDVASAIKEKKGTTDLIQPKDFDTEIQSISGGAISNLTLDISGADISARAIKELFEAIVTLQTITFEDVVINRNNFLKYTLLDYIQSTGTQYIDTLCLCDSTLYTFEMLFSKVGTSSDEDYFGVHTSPSTLFGLYGSDFRYVATNFNNNRGTYYYSSNFGYSKMTMGKSCKFNDYVILDNNIKFQHNENAYIFGSNSGGSRVGGNTNFKLHNFIVYDAVTNNIVKYLLPIIDNNDIACLYDIISDQLYYNQGEGNFITGPIVINSNEINNGVVEVNLSKNSINGENINDLFTRYQEIRQFNFRDAQLTREEFYNYTKLEYLESTGTQYIDTNIIGSYNIGMDITFVIKDALATSNYGTVFGSRTSPRKNEYMLSSYGNGGTFTANGTGRKTGIGMVANEVQSMSYHNGTLTTNGGTYTYTSNTAVTPVPITLFALNENGTKIQYGKVQLYTLSFYDDTNNTKIREFIPALDGLGTPCLYDTVTKKYYYNQGTGEFLFA